MKKISTLFDALRNEKFAIAVQDDYGIKYYGYAGQGREWAQWANSVEVKSLEESQIPSGIIQGPYKNMLDSEIKSLIVSFGYAENSASGFIKSKSYSHSASVKIKSNSIVPAIMDTPISYFTSRQYGSSVSYKCLSMRHSIKEGSFLHEAKVNRYAFNFNKSMYNASPDSEQNKSLRQRVDLHVGRSSERRIGIKIKSYLVNYSETRNKVGAIDSLETKSIANNLEFKELGSRLGGVSRLGRRTARAAVSMFDPKAWDGDGDGVVQEGTPYERPAIPGINDRASGGRVDAAAASRAWQDFSRAGSSPKPVPPKRSTVVLDDVKPLPKRRTMTTAPSTPPQRTIMATAPRPPVARKPEGTPRVQKQPSVSGKPVPQSRSVPKRIGEARTQRQVQGLASRSGKTTSRKKPGIDKVKDTDGQIFESLDDAQKKTITENMKLRYQEIQDNFKLGYADADSGDRGWFESFVKKTQGKGISKNDADNKPWNENSRISGEALKSLEGDISDTLEQIDDEINDLEIELQTEIKKPDSDIKTQESLRRKIKALQKEKSDWKENLEDLLVFDAMYESDDWSLVEHLSGDSRKAVFGKTVSTETKGKTTKGKKSNVYNATAQYEYLDLGAVPKQDFKTPSSFYEVFSANSEAKRAIFGGKMGSKLKAYQRRVFDNAEAARAKRQLRKQRRGLSFGLGADRPGKPNAKERARRALRRTGRRIKRKLTGGVSAADVQSEINKTKQANPTVFGNGKGDTPSITLEAIRVLASLKGLKGASEKDLTEGQKGRNAGSLLGRMWNAQGYNGLATPVSEEDADFLISQGWKPIQRGHGTPPPPGDNKGGALGWAQDYIEDPNRFITGEGGTAYGPGEYWARHGTGWDGYLSEGLGTLALVSPDARVQTIGESRQLAKEHDSAWRIVGAALQGIGGGTIGAKDMDPQDLVKELRAALSRVHADGDPFWSSEVGEVMSQFFSFMASASASPGEKESIWNALQYMLDASRGDSHYVSMLYGYDGVDHLGDSPVIWFNRGALAIVDKPVEVSQIKDLVRNK